MAAAKSKKKTAVTPTTKPKLKSQKTHSKEEREDSLKAIDAISDDSDDDDENNHSIDEYTNDDNGEEWDQEAMALRKMISEGKFHDLLKRHDVEKKKKKGKGANAMEADVEEDEIEDEDDDANNSEQDEEETNSDEGDEGNKDEGSSDDDEEEEGKLQASNPQETRGKALLSAIQSSNRNLPFAESFTIVPPTPLPFGPKAPLNNNPDDGDEEEGAQSVDIHDDLKREVTFYDTALEAVNLAREECEKVGIPFHRPEDFFAEMVKTDGECRTTICLRRN
jgi:rRNA-processing protein EBP2